MSNKSLKDSIKDKFEHSQLSDDQWQALQEQIAEANAADSGDVSNQPPSRRTFITAASAASIAAVLLANNFLGNGSIPLDIANEVTRNHFKDKPMEIVSSEYPDLGGYLRALPFQPIRSHRDELRGSLVLGARYCSLKTEPAAQIRLIDSHGIKQTLYQATYNEDDFGEIPDRESLIVESRGKQVHIWRENGLLFALTSGS